MSIKNLKNLSNQELKDIMWLIFKARKITGKNKEKEIIRNHLLLDMLLKLDKQNNKEAKRKAKIIEKIPSERNLNYFLRSLLDLRKL